MSEVLECLSDLAAKYKLVPFMGAGCSAHMLPDWDTIIAEMAQEMGIESQDNLCVAQEYENRFGREGFCSFLKKKLEIAEFVDAKGLSHITVMKHGGSVYLYN